MALLTNKAILTAFEEMLEEMPFDKITVTALIRRSGVSSNTFYYHYRDIYDLLGVWLEQFLTPVREAKSASWTSSAKEMLTICKTHPKIVYHVCESLSRERLERYVFSASDDIIYRNIRQESADKRVTDEQVEEIACFCRYSLVGFLLKFIWDRMETDVDEIVAAVGELMENFVKSSVDMYDRKNRN